MRQLERNVLLNVIDRKWREHLYEMDYLKEGIGLRAMAQRDPLVEYQREGFDMFTGMLEGLKEESVGFLFNVQVEAAPPHRRWRRWRLRRDLRSSRSARRRLGPIPPRQAPTRLLLHPLAAPTTGRPRHAAPGGLRAKGIDDERVGSGAHLQRPVRGRRRRGATAKRRRRSPTRGAVGRRHSSRASRSRTS